MYNGIKIVYIFTICVGVNFKLTILSSKRKSNLNMK